MKKKKNSIVKKSNDQMQCLSAKVKITAQLRLGVISHSPQGMSDDHY